MKFLHYIIIFTISFFLLSCANTVSTKEVTIDVDITITLNAPVNRTSYYYGVALSKTTPKISTPQDNEYIPLPGRLFNPGTLGTEPILKQTLTYFYDEYFSSWIDYIIIDENGALLYKSNATQFTFEKNENNINDTTSHTRYVSDSTFPASVSLSNDNTTLSFTIPVDLLSTELSNSTELKMTFFTIEKEKDSSPDDQAGRLRDFDSPAQKLKLQANETLENKNLEGNIDQSDFSADIKSYNIKVF